MNITKELNTISWQVTEPEYRADPALSYSTLARFEREGFDKLDHLFDKIESPSLLFGSCVDTLLTEGEDAFNKKFQIFNLNCTEGGINTVIQLVEAKLPFNRFEDIPKEVVSDYAKKAGFWKDDRWDSKRYAKVLETGNVAEYYQTFKNSDKVIVSKETFEKAVACVNVLRENPMTSWCFAPNNGESSIKRYYQLKFKATFQNVNYRAMMDLVIVDYEDKKIYPIDLKTSGKFEWHFDESFLQFNYDIQARLYWRILKDNIARDSYFKDFTLENFRFIVVNSYSLTPLVWEFPLCSTVGPLLTEQGSVRRDPLVIGEELQKYLQTRPRVPEGIKLNEINSLSCLKAVNV